MEPFPTRDPIEGLHFTFHSDRANPEVEEQPTPRRERPARHDNGDGSAGSDGSDGDDDEGRLHWRVLRLGETPLTDPRSLGGSAFVHVLLVALALLTVQNVSILRTRETAPTLKGEIDTVDNRADASKPVGDGGGSPGEMGGLGSVAFVAPAAGNDPEGPGPDAAADALLNEILPRKAELPDDALRRALPGPQTTGIGLVPGPGLGGGGGAGGGSGGGVGKGIGPGTEFFGAREHAHSFAYVIDCSGSMALRSSLIVAKHELLASLNQLPPDARFSVIFYNERARVFSDPHGQQGMMPATAANKVRVRTQLQGVLPDGGTDHMVALRTALGLKPEVVFFLTDADQMDDNDVNHVLTEVHGSRIQAVEFGIGPHIGRQTPLNRLAVTTGGSYRFIDVTSFPRSASGY